MLLFQVVQKLPQPGLTAAKIEVCQETTISQEDLTVPEQGTEATTATIKGPNPTNKNSIENVAAFPPAASIHPSLQDRRSVTVVHKTTLPETNSTVGSFATTNIQAGVPTTTAAPTDAATLAANDLDLNLNLKENTKKYLSNSEEKFSPVEPDEYVEDKAINVALFTETTDNSWRTPHRPPKQASPPLHEVPPHAFAEMKPNAAPAHRAVVLAIYKEPQRLQKVGTEDNDKQEVASPA